LFFSDYFMKYLETPTKVQTGEPELGLEY